MAEGKSVSGKAIAAGALSGIGAIGTFKLIESLTKKVEDGEPVALDPETLALLAAMAAGIEESSRGVAANAAGINALLAAAGEPLAMKKIVQIPFRHTIVSGTVQTLREHAPFSGYITAVMTHFPDGCNSTVDVAVSHGLTQFCPKEDYLALNNATPIFTFNEYVEDYEDLKVKLRNRGLADHTITVTLFLSGAE